MKRFCQRAKDECTVIIMGWGWSVGRLGAQSGPRKSLQHPETTKAGWIHVFMLFTTN